ncbi:MAG: hypothetical protein AAB391_03085 [Patescibacteria group bacterium]
MFNISNFLAKFSNLRNNAFVVRDAFIQVAQDVAGITLLGTQVEVKEGVARVQAHSMIKNVLHIKKEAILEVLRQKGVALKDIK